MDPVTQHVAKLQIEKEQNQQRAKFKPMLTVQEVMVASKKTLMRRTKKAVKLAEIGECLEHSQSLPHQGELHRLMERDAATLWSETMQKLPPEALKFALNTAQDTLPHNANLAIWRRSEGLSSHCKLCGERQTLAHIFNHCQVALDLRRYNVRHDAVLEVIDQFVRENCPPDVEAITDLAAYDYTFPTCIAPTDLRPDVVLWSPTQKSAILELTVCYETNFEDAHRRKANKYEDLVEAGRSNGFDTSTVTLEVGSRGFLNLDGFKCLFSNLKSCSNKKQTPLLTRCEQEGHTWVTPHLDVEKLFII